MIKDAIPVGRQQSSSSPMPRPWSSSPSRGVVDVERKLLDSSYKDVWSTPAEVGGRFLDHLLNSPDCLVSVLDALNAEPGKTGVFDFSIELDMHEFIRKNPVLGNMLLRYPGPLLPLLEEAIVEAQREVWKRLQVIEKASAKNDGSGTEQNHRRQPPLVKGEKNTRVHARLVHLPPHASCCRPSISSLSCNDVGGMIQIPGTVVRKSAVQCFEGQRAYVCCEKGCGESFVRKADLEQRNNALDAPTCCPNSKCQGTKFKDLPEGTVRSDYQEIKIQESLSQRSSLSSDNGSRSMPQSLLVKLQHDLVDRCQPGDDVVIVGSLISQWTSSGVANMGDCNVTMAIDAHSIRVGGGGGRGRRGGGSSWDGVFNDLTEEVDGEGENNNNNSNDVTPRKKKFSVIREEIDREFTGYWSENTDRPITARNFICGAVCPALYGMFMVKIGLLLTLIGGCSGASDGTHEGEGKKRHQRMYGHSSEDGNDQDTGQHGEKEGPKMFSLHEGEETKDTKTQGLSSGGTHGYSGDSTQVQTRRREQSHLLLVGDPGTGKSQFLRFAAALCPRSVLTNGSGTTSAGLTCAAVREDSGRDFTLEAGALVLADKGVCAIDEFGCINEKDRTTIHEAMEQQTLSVAKAGIVCKLNCRATVIAVTNAKGGLYDHEKNFQSNVGIGAPLLSRFDIIFKLIDSSDEMKDDNVATFLLNQAISGAGYDCSKKYSDALTVSHWSMDKLRAYIATVKGFQPTLSRNASIILQRHYEKCRGSDNMSINITVRFLESLIRLSQAHARLMYRSIVQLDDAVAVILIMNCSVASLISGFYDENSFYKDPLNAVPQDADLEFLLDKVRLLKMYDMSKCITENERIISEQNEPGHDSKNISIVGTQSSPWDYYDNNKSQAIIRLPQISQSENYGHQIHEDHYGRITQNYSDSQQTPRRIAKEDIEQYDQFKDNKSGNEDDFYIRKNSCNEQRTTSHKRLRRNAD